jgi:hypothetical protein
MLDRCACKRGFFTLRDCGNAAATSCTACTRRVCAEHVAGGVEPQLCVECAATREETRAVGTTASVVRTRTRYYHTTEYTPMWWATRDPYWGDSGYRWYSGGGGHAHHDHDREHDREHGEHDHDHGEHDHDDHDHGEHDHDDHEHDEHDHEHEQDDDFDGDDDDGGFEDS